MLCEMDLGIDECGELNPGIFLPFLVSRKMLCAFLKVMAEEICSCHLGCAKFSSEARRLTSDVPLEVHKISSSVRNASYHGVLKVASAMLGFAQSTEEVVRHRVDHCGRRDLLVHCWVL